jgi:hypothetical protein
MSSILIKKLDIVFGFMTIDINHEIN